MNHPPVPPNECPLFRMSTGQWRVRFKMPHVDNWYDLDDVFGETRLIIAAVARTCWLDEMTRLDSIRPYSGEYFAAWKVARDNAEAWRVWGEAK